MLVAWLHMSKWRKECIQPTFQTVTMKCSFSRVNQHTLYSSQWFMAQVPVKSNTENEPVPIPNFLRTRTTRHILLSFDLSE